tara:strand:- start:46 stop:783 length:738 start_codon:yes stop_codon:yes gene_type:complete
MSILDSIYRNVYPLILGQYGYGNNQIGIYSRVDNLGKLSTSPIATIVQKVSYPILSKLDYKDKNYKSLISSVMSFATNLSIITSTLLMLFGHEIVTIIYGNLFYDAGTYIKPILFMTVLFPINAILINEYILSGKFKELYFSEIIRKLFGFFFLVLAASYSLTAFAWAIGIWGVISTLINIFFLGERISFIRKSIYIISIKSLSLIACTYFLSLFFENLYVKTSLFAIISIYLLIDLKQIYESFR